MRFKWWSLVGKTYETSIFSSRQNRRACLQILRIIDIRIDRLVSNRDVGSMFHALSSAPWRGQTKHRKRKKVHGWLDHLDQSVLYSARLFVCNCCSFHRQFLGATDQSIGIATLLSSTIFRTGQAVIEKSSYSVWRFVLLYVCDSQLSCSSKRTPPSMQKTPQSDALLLISFGSSLLLR